MTKENNKTNTEYHYNLKVKGEFESIIIEQEENVKDRDAVLVNLYQERWRTPQDYIELLEKVILIVKKDFLKNNIND